MIRSSASWTTPLPRISRKKGPTSHPRQITMNRGSTLPLKSMFRCWSALVALAVSLNVMSHHGTIASPSIAAATPPMGWNSYDGYGTTINEAQFKANAEWFAKHLKPYGWQYLVIDAEWFVTNPVAEGNSKTFRYSMDQFGRYTPPASRFPS